MNCLVIAATTAEITPFLEHYRDPNTQWANNIEIDVLITGIGLTSTTYSVTRQLHIKRPDVVVQAGIAGCYHKNVKLGSVVAVKREIIADQCVIENGELKTMMDLKLMKPNQFPYTKGWLVNKNDVLNETNARKVKAISINEITTSKRMIGLYSEKFNPAIESMEGAALHYACLREDIPFLQLRGVSNYIGERNKKKWNMKESIINLNNELIRLLQNL